jgi:hypothetical protein
MSPRILAAAKIPQDWSDLLDQRARDEGLSRSQIIQDAIAQYLDQPMDEELTLVSLFREVEKLKKDMVLDVESLYSEIALLHDKLSNILQDQHSIPKPVSPTDNNDQSESARLVNGRNDYRSLVNQFLNRQRLGQQSSKAKFLKEFVKYLQSQD